ncbi:GNAT family N-acetyltransferase [Brevundimonas aurifodinae]|uniref:GNAT family N-acetyltransferase n=2 Tax=Brevundimonas TaxID=41275 RepID=A0ABV1NJ91_9CAUL|nr:MAG: GNAT family N-acetyltransferase [Brevundimonas sp. 12-68-7]OYX34783.1 MAG: GNAT family N-acetyltransferase [Brevundimonas subvibrioides]
MDHPLDRPLWNALTGRLSEAALGDAHAVRIDPEVGVFAAAADASPDSVAALAALCRAHPGAGLVELEGGPMDGVLPTRVEIISRNPCLQMICEALTPAPEDDGLEVVVLGDADAAEMLALATLTKPGPFRPRTHRLGGFIGVRRDGRLAAMAGRRLRVEGHTELSGVCTHPDFRGHGLATALSRRVVAAILAEGETAFLHAYATHEATVALYESLGFHARARVTYTVLA